jgi:hypothetical protein
MRAMKRIVDGKLYDTGTAKIVAKWRWGSEAFSINDAGQAVGFFRKPKLIPRRDWRYWAGSSLSRRMVRWTPPLPFVTSMKPRIKWSWCSSHGCCWPSHSPTKWRARSGPC